ncbi:MAG: endolytic transglycosylase MltG [Tidjanibacter sp.]|nr:endolytic transglycosylase MltG [Tidjanibacter sp.]
MKKSIKVISILVVAGFILAACAMGVLYKYRYTDFIVKSGTIHIPSEGGSYAMLCDSLMEKEMAKTLTAFEWFANLRGFKNNIKAGRYELKEGMSINAVFNRIGSGSQSAVQLTFNNIRTLPQLAGRIGDQLEADSLSFLNYLLCDTVAEHYGFDAKNFIGMFIPNTYEVWWTTTPKAFTDRMKREYDNFWNEERQAKLKRTGLSRQQVITLAAIVDEETNATEEMPTIAGVYINRLRIGMPLQADPTVKFAVGDFTLRRVLIRHTKTDSPYNTYMHQGLPPGPICMPSVSAIDAVLNYSDHKYLYFCAKEDFSGRHNFARTLAEHNRNARAYAAALNKANIK